MDRLFVRSPETGPREERTRRSHRQETKRENNLLSRKYPGRYFLGVVHSIRPNESSKKRRPPIFRSGESRLLPLNDTCGPLDP